MLVAVFSTPPGAAHQLSNCHAGPDDADFQSTNLGTNRDFVSIPPLDAEDFDKGGLQQGADIWVGCSRGADIWALLGSPGCLSALPSKAVQLQLASRLTGAATSLH